MVTTKIQMQNLLGRPYVLPVMFSFFQRVISELPRPITAKLHHTIRTCVYFINWLQKFGDLSPPKNWGQKPAKFRSISYNLRLWSRISPEWLKISKNGKLMFPDRFLLRSKKTAWWTLVHLLQRSDSEFGPTKMHFFAYYISALRGCCALKFLFALEIELGLLAHPPRWRGSPKKF